MTLDLIPEEVANAIALINAVQPRVACGESVSPEERAQLKAAVVTLCMYVGHDGQRGAVVAEALIT